MSRRRVLACIVSVVLLGSAPASAVQIPNLTGTWSGTFTTTDPPDEDPAHLVLTQTGSGLTGTGGPNPDRQWPIANGKVATTKAGTIATFDVAADESLIHFELKLVDGRLKGIANAERNGQKVSALVDVQRTK